MRTLLKIAAGIVATLVIVGGLWLYAPLAALDSTWSRDEVARVSSPSGKIDAVMFELNGGATTSFSYDIYVVRHGEDPKKSDPKHASLYAAVRNADACGANLKWEDDTRLIVEYLSARFANATESEVRVGSDPVLIVLRSGMADTTAPPGGMLDSLNRPKQN